jgi:hypothetical protein
MAYGIPNIPGFASSVTDSLIGFGGAALINAIFGNYWGVFDQNGIPLLLADNVTKVAYQNSSKVSNAPVEQGTFAHYNKVNNPNQVTVQLTKGSGGALERGAFIALVDAFAGSIDLFTIITPEKIYPDCNIIGVDYSREAGDGARMIKVNITFEQIRQVTVKYTKTEEQDTSAAQSDGAQNPTNGGQQQPQAANESLLSKGMSAIKGMF